MKLKIKKQKKKVEKQVLVKMEAFQLPIVENKVMEVP